MLTALNQCKGGRLDAVQSFRRTWKKFIDYWNTVRQQESIATGILELV